MALVPIRLLPGVNTQSTPTLAAAQLVDSNFIRWVRADNQVVWQKLGGWTKFFPNSVGSAIRALGAWQDNAANLHLAVGAEDSLSVITDGTRVNITPATTTTNPPPNFTTLAGSTVVTVVDVGSNPSTYMTVFFNTPVAVGGIILSGAFLIQAVLSADSYTISIPVQAVSAESNAGSVPQFATTSGEPIITVTLIRHGYAVGDTFVVAVPVTVGGLTLSGPYTVQTADTDDTFTINAPNSATSAATVHQNSGNAQLVYYITTGPAPPGSGYGAGGYGSGGYGVGSVTPANPGTPITATDWSLPNFGQVLIASPEGGPLYAWSPEGGLGTASVVTSAPFVNGGVLMAMPQQQLIAWGSEVALGAGAQDPLLVRWSDVGDYTTWLASSTNEAGSRRLSRGSRIVGALQVATEILLWTDVGAWSMQYIGPDDVYGFSEIGQGCGLIGRAAMGSIGNQVYWMGSQQFFTKRGAVEPLDCPVWDAVFQDLDTDNQHKIRCAVNSAFNEVTWYYPSTSGGTGENDRYVKYNSVLRTWDIGALQRTAWIDVSVLGTPIGADASGYIYQHETSDDADGSPMNWYAQTGYFMIQDGDQISFVDYIVPDFKFGKRGQSPSAQVSVTVQGVQYPSENATPTTKGPLLMISSTKYLSTRMRARQISMYFSGGDVGSFVRYGALRARVSVDGRRP